MVIPLDTYKELDTHNNQMLTFRPIIPEDEQLLFSIYASTRDEEMSKLDHWSESEKLSFVQNQFYAQHEYYQSVYPNGTFGILNFNGIDIGRLYLNYSQETLRIIDITLLPMWRNKKIGSNIIEKLKEDATNKSITLSIHVETFNPALELYKKLGFKKIKETNGVYWLMEWKNNDDI